MKDLPDIDPEIRGLLEELVADPRSAIRLAPRRALRSWFDAGDAVSTRDVSLDRLQRHLVEVHREALALLLREAARIAYWKAPVLSHRPVEKDGSLYDPNRAETSWMARARRRVEQRPHADEGVELLRQCLDDIDPKRGYDLARASMSLVPTDEARIAIAGHLRQAQPRSSLHVFERLGRRAASPNIRGLARAGAAGRLCFLQQFDAAVEAYELAKEEWPNAWFCLFNLACAMGEDQQALGAAQELAQIWPLDGQQLREAVTLLSNWLRSLDRARVETAKRTLLRLRSKLPLLPAKLGEAYA